MSDRLAAKIKDNAGKPKYSSLNLNQTYKGNKVEIKTSTGATRHGLQSLGKIGSSRRIPPPANLPSLKSENSGNDPTVSLVPSGGGGWGSAKEKTDSASPTTISTPPPSNIQPSQSNVVVTQQPSLQPQRPTPPSSYPTQVATQQQSQNLGPTRQENTTSAKQEKSEVQAKTWGSVSQSEAGGQGKTYSHQPTPYFNREFPTLGGQDNGEAKPDGKENYGPAPVIRNTHEPPWMERSGPGPPPHGYTRNNDTYNGGQAFYHRRPADFQNNRANMQQYPPQQYGNNYYPGQAGRPPPQHGYTGQDQHDRPTYQRSGQNSKQGARQDRRQDQDRDNKKPVVRPSVLRPEDIQAMDDEDDDGGWAGAHGEVDYTAKLNFEDFEEEDKDWAKENIERPSKEHNKDEEQQSQDSEREPVEPREPVILRRPPQVNDRPKQPKSAWGELPQRPQELTDSNRPPRPFDSQRPGSEQRAAWNMQYPPPNQTQSRVPPGQYPPLSGSPHAGQDVSPGNRPPNQEGPVTRRDSDPPDEWTLKRQKQQEEMHAAVERARKRREQEELELQAKTKAAAMMRLKAIEEKAKQSDVKSESAEPSDNKETKADFENEKEQKERKVKDVDHVAASTEQKPVVNLRPEDHPRRRADSDSSDTSRSSGSRQFYHQQRNIPPRFQQQRQQQQQQYQQQQLYQASHQTSAYPHRDFYDPAVPRPPQTVDSGPVSPSGKTSRPGDAVPVKRIMKRSDSSSTAGEDVASVKSLESVGDKERGSGTSVFKETEGAKTDSVSKHKDSETARKDGNETRKQDNQRKPNDYERPSDQKQFDKSGDNKEDVSVSSGSARKREYKPNDKKVEEPHKRKRDEHEDLDWDDRRGKLGRERQTDSRGRLRQATTGRGRGRGIGRGRQDYRSDGGDNRQRHVRDSRSRDSRDIREQKKEMSDKNERQKEPKGTEDQKKDNKDKVFTDDSKDKTDIKKEGRSDRENHDRKTYHQDQAAQRDMQEKEKGERKMDKFEKRSDRYDDRPQRPKKFDSRKDSRESRDETKRDSVNEKDEPKHENYKTNRDEPRKERDNREPARRGRFASRDIREEERFNNQRTNRDGDRYQDHNKQNQEGNKERELERYKDKPREERDKNIKDYDRYRDKDSFRSKRDYTARRDRGGHRTQFSTRGRGSLGRGLRSRGSGRLVGSGRIVASNYNRPTKKEEFSDNDDTDDSGSESSSYTTATSASEERPEEKEEKPKEQPRSTSQSSSSTRGLKSPRGNRGRGGNYLRSRPQPEKPPRFQKQQERAAQQRNSGRGGMRVDRNSVRGSRGRGRGRGRGHIVSSSQDNDEGKGDTVTVIEATENWDEDVDSSSKEQSRDEKPSTRKGGFPRSSYEKGSNRRGSSRDESGKFSSRREGNQSNTQSRKGDSFLAEKQVKVEGSKSASGEPRGSLPAVKMAELTSSKKNSGTPKDDKRTDYGAVDSIDGKVVPKRNDTVKKANIELFDLHNVAGVICIDDIPDDASDISSSGFVEVTSKRTQKELKEKQREEDERRKRNEEKANQRNSDSKFKKNQTSKPPRFSKQHQSSNAQSKSFDGKLPVPVSLEGAPGLVSGSIGSNPSSTNSTKRNSPITVDRPLSPQGPVFNAWNKPLTLVTPAKAPGTTLVMTSNVPDPLAVGSGKPPRQPPPSTVMPIQNSLIEDIEDDDLKEITKEIESMAPTEEQEEVNIVSNKSSESSSSSARDKHQDNDKKTQPKPQRERPPRFERTVKKRNGSDDTLKKDLPTEDAKKEKDLPSMDKESSESSQSKVSDKHKPDDKDQVKGKEEHPNVSSNAKRIKDDVTEKGIENDSPAPRKDSDYSVDSEGNGDSSMFSGRPLSVDIADSSEPQERPPTPVSPTYEMSKRMYAARQAWDKAPSSSVGLTAVAMDSPSTWSESNTAPVSRTVVNSSSNEGSSLGESTPVKVNETREIADDTVVKSDVSKSAETQFIAKKPGGNEQQNVCKVKPQQQQAVKPQHVLLAASTEERRPSDLDTMAPSQTVIAQDHLLPQNVSSSYPFQLEPHILQLQHRQPQHFMQPLQSLQQSTQVPANRYQIQPQIQQVPHQPTSAPSPLSQSPQELFQSQYLANNLYSASGFPGSQSFVSIPIVATTTTPSFATSSTRTQSLQGQQPKTVTSSMFGQPGSQAQTVYMPFDPQNIGGTPTLLNFNQQSQAQRPIIGNHGVGFPDVVTQQQHMAQTNQHQASQQFQRPFAFQTKPSFENEHNPSMKTLDQSQSDLNHQQSEMVKHINAKPFEPPKRLSTPTSSTGAVGLMASGVNPNVVHIRPNAPNIGALSHSPPMQTPFISSRPVSMSPVDPNVPFAAGANSFAKHAPIGHYQVPQQQRQQPPVQQFTPFQQQPVHIKPQQLQQHQPIHLQQAQPNHSQQQHNPAHIAPSGGPAIPPQALIQRQYGAVGTVRPSQHAVGNQHFPGPIQRPPSSGVMPTIPPNILQHQQNAVQQPRAIRQQVSRMPHNIQKPPMMSNRPPMPQQMQVGGQQNPFKALQHQKMLEETRMFFANQDQQVKMKSQQQNEADKPNLLPQQQVPKQGQPFQQSNLKQMHSQPKQVQDSKMPSQHSRQLLQQKQVPLAPSSGVHHQAKPPRMSQDKSKQLNQDKKDKKEENKSHIIELPRKKLQDNKSKQTKLEPTKNEDTSQTSKLDGKTPINKRGGPIRIAPMIQKPPQGGGRGNRLNKPRVPLKNTSSVQGNKPKAEVPTTRPATGTTATATGSASKPANETAASSKGKDPKESSVKESGEVQAAEPLSANT